MRKMLSAQFVAKVTKPGVYQDTHGLRLHVRKGGSKQFEWRGTIHGVRRDLGLGGFPYTSLKEARDTAFKYRKLARDGGDPRELRKRGDVPTFAEAAEIVIRLHEPNWRDGAKSAKQWRASLDKYAFPRLGRMPVGAISAQDILAVLKPNWNERRETMGRVKQRIGAIMKWAVAEGHRDSDPVPAVTAALPKNGNRKTHHKALPWQQVGTAVETIRQTNAWICTKLCFEFIVLTAARSGEARLARWDEIDLEAAVWTVPGERMKAGKEHRVPLSDAALSVLSKARAFRDRSGLVFPSATGKAMTDNTLSKLCRENDLGCVPHGFRSSFRDWCGETGKDRELAEQALAHVVKGVEGAYARSDLLERRRDLMSQWSQTIEG